MSFRNVGNHLIQRQSATSRKTGVLDYAHCRIAIGSMTMKVCSCESHVFSRLWAGFGFKVTDCLLPVVVS